MTESTTAETGNDGPTIAYGKTAQETAIEELGFKINEDSVIVDKSGEPILTANGNQVTTDSLAGFIDKNGSPVPVKSTS